MARLTNNISAQDQVVIDRCSKQLRKLRSDMIHLFPEREWLINQLMLALITGQHVLVYGSHGTAKSLMAQTLVDAIINKGTSGEQKQFFSIQFDAETTIDKLIGGPNIPLLNQTGEMVPMYEGFLPTAHFAFLDEVFDAPIALRSLNDMLNERRLMEGKLDIPIPLLMAIAATNRSPEDIESLYPILQLDAFHDRFLFVCKVGYLKSNGSVSTMLANYVSGVKLNSTVEFADVQRVNAIIKGENQIPSTEFLDVYAEVIQVYRQALQRETNAEISDRRVAWLTQVIEAQAILQGRPEVYLDDIRAIAYALAPSEDSKENALFKQVAEPILEAAKDAFDEHIDEIQRKHLDRMETDIQSLSNTVNDQNWNPSNQEIGALLRELKNLSRELSQIQVQLDINEQMRLRLIAKAEQLVQIVNSKL